METVTHRTRNFVILISFAIANILLWTAFNIYPDLHPMRLLAQVLQERHNITSNNGIIVSRGRSNDIPDSRGIVSKRRPDNTPDSRAIVSRGRPNDTSDSKGIVSKRRPDNTPDSRAIVSRARPNDTSDSKGVVWRGRPNDTSDNKGIVSREKPNDTSKNGVLDGLLNTSVDGVKYRNLNEIYNKRIASIPRKKYNPSYSHIDIGPPLSSLLNVSQKVSSQPKLILLWTPFFGDKEYLDDTRFKQCPETRCHITTDKSKLMESHGVIMHARDMSGKQSLPPTRQPWQRWIYFLLESPVHNYLRLQDFKNIFNWTATFRLDADINIGYGGLYKRETPLNRNNLDVLLSNIMKTKKKLVAARISNCGSRTNRLQYITELQKHIPVDVYGHCGTLSNPKGKAGDDILKQYKFYLAFENSHCRDYITEKFWHTFAVLSTVPVVMGAAPEDYQAVAPNHTFIHTAGFESPKQLAEYLQLLDKNDHLYKRYFTWHTQWEPYEEYFKNPLTTSKQWCNLCSDLHNISLPLQLYRDFDGWYKEDYCKK